MVRLAPTVGAVVDNRDMPDICLQHMVAVMLIDRTASFKAAHDKARMRDAAVLRQRAKVDLLPDPTLAALLPARVAVVEVTLTDGTRLSDRVEAVRGTVRNPMTRDEVVAKAARPHERRCSAAAQPQRADRYGSSRSTASTDVRALRPMLQRAQPAAPPTASTWSRKPSTTPSASSAGSQGTARQLPVHGGAFRAPPEANAETARRKSSLPKTRVTKSSPSGRLARRSRAAPTFAAHIVNGA